MQRFSKSRSGFSLVEVVIAIGIAAFTLATIGGIFGITNQSALDSSHDTLITSMIGQVMGDLRPLPFDTLWSADPRGATPAYLASLAPAATPIPPANPPSNSTYYFTSEGVLIEPSATGAFSATGYTNAPVTTVYRCTVTKTPDPATESFGANAGYNRLQLTLRFDWPIPSNATPVPQGAVVTVSNGPNVKTVYESIARYF